MIPHLAPNQKAVRIIKAPTNSDHPYSLINKSAAIRAMQNLRNAALRLWLYLSLNQGGYEMGLSQKDVYYTCDISKPTYLAAVHELIDKGYLVEVELYPKLKGYLFLEDAEMTQADGGEPVIFDELDKKV